MSRRRDGRGKSRPRLLRVSVAELRPQWPLWLAVLVGILPSVGFHTLQPLLFRAVIDEAIIPRNAGRLLVLKCNTDVDPAVGAELRISSIPTLALFRSGRELARSSGARPAAAIDAFVRQALGQAA